MLRDFLRRQPLRQRIQNYRDIDPCTLNARFAATHVGFHHHPLKKSSVWVISHFSWNSVVLAAILPHSTGRDDCRRDGHCSFSEASVMNTRESAGVAKS